MTKPKLILWNSFLNYWWLKRGGGKESVMARERGKEEHNRERESERESPIARGLEWRARQHIRTVVRLSE